MVYKDACNRKSNHQHLGTIKCSNLCTEIVEYSSPEETAVCNLASISLPNFVNPKEKTFDFDQLQYVTRVVTRNLNKVIDRGFYPVEEVRSETSPCFSSILVGISINFRLFRPADQICVIVLLVSVFRVFVMPLS